MTAVNCPMCELRFATRTERDWHLRNEHRHHARHHEAPARAEDRPGRAAPTPASAPGAAPEE